MAPEEIEQAKKALAYLETKAAYWEAQSRIVPPEESLSCVSYVKHLRTLAELERLTLLD